MNPTTALQTIATPAPQLPLQNLFKRADVTCGDLLGAYSGIQPPVCSGSTSICTFTGRLQGCCDSSGSCQSYTTCLGGEETATCTDSQCTKCPQSAVYCTKYNFYDNSNQQSYDGYSCGTRYIESATIFGSAVSAGVATVVTTVGGYPWWYQVGTSFLGSLVPSPQTFTTMISVSSNSALSSDTSRSTSSIGSSGTSQTSTTGASTSISSALSTSSSISTSFSLSSASSRTTGIAPTSTAIPSTSVSSSHTGAIAGGVVGCILAASLVGGLVWYILRRRGNHAVVGQNDLPRMEQPWRD